MDRTSHPGGKAPGRGTIKAWKPAKQLGFIEEPGEIDAFFHANEWKGPTDPEQVLIEEGCTQTPKGEHFWTPPGGGQVLGGQVLGGHPLVHHTPRR